MCTVFRYQHAVVAFCLHFFCMGAFAQPTLRINEFMAENSSILKDMDGEFSDWIEIYNPTGSEINLLGWSLTDTKEEPGKWKFPSVKIAAQSYLLVFASGKNWAVENKELHTNFKLSKSGEFLGLFNALGAKVSVFEPAFPEQKENLSYAFDGTNYLECLSPTPGIENKFSEKLQTPVISKKHGFFNAPFKVALTTSQTSASVYYTTNGNEPEIATGTLYSDSVQITKTTVLRARAFNAGSKSPIVTQTYLFIDDVLKQPNNPDGYPSTWGPYTGIQGTATADYEMDPDIVQNEQYKNDFLDAMLTLPTISVVTDIGNLFSKNTDPTTGGIYIYTGAPGNNDLPELGEDWERPASVEFFSNDGLVDYTANCGLRLHGGHSRRAEKTPKHSFRLAFRETYGSPKMNYPLFGKSDNVAQSFNSLIIRAGYGNSWLHMTSVERNRNQLIRDLWAKDKQLEMGNPAGHGSFAHLYLNGLYWGVYNPTEWLDKNFATTYLGGNKDDYDVIKDYAEVADGNITAWNEMMSLARNGLSTDEKYYRIQGKDPDGTANASLTAYVDVQNLADYMILNFYGSNSDWDHHNWTAIRNRVNPGAGFKFFVWDAEHVIESVNANITNEKNTNCPSELFQLLVKNEKFKHLFASRVELFCKNNGVLTPAQCQQTWSRRSGQVEPAIIAESARWGDYRRDVHPYYGGPFELYTKEHWTAQKQFIENTYFPNRTNAFLSELKTANLYPYSGPYTEVFDVYGNSDKSWLGQNYPNPFRGNTTITFNLAQPGMVLLVLYNALGKEVKTIEHGFKDQGRHASELDASSLPSGTYYYKLILNGNTIQTRKMMVIDPDF